MSCRTCLRHHMIYNAILPHSVQDSMKRGGTFLFADAAGLAAEAEDSETKQAEAAEADMQDRGGRAASTVPISLVAVRVQGHQACLLRDNDVLTCGAGRQDQTR
eukprot:1000801-Alexandrium_andersonii.AAC.1